MYDLTALGIHDSVLFSNFVYGSEPRFFETVSKRIREAAI